VAYESVIPTYLLKYLLHLNVKKYLLVNFMILYQVFKLLDINCNTLDEYYYDSEATWDKEVASDVTTHLFTGIVPKIAKYFDR
jgi:hypothetical protein